MADTSDIAAVRKNTDEPDETTFNNDYVSSLVDSLGVAGASALIWRQKAAKYADLVTTSEAGATHQFSDLQKHALDMASEWDTILYTESAPVEALRPKVRKIVRS